MFPRPIVDDVGFQLLRLKFGRSVQTTTIINVDKGNATLRGVQIVNFLLLQTQGFVSKRKLREWKT